MPVEKYRPYCPIGLPDRRWPERSLGTAPLWCSVDLRDGNQALLDPMNPERKLTMFELLVRLGFTEIEVGFPTACQADWDFVRDLAHHDRVPEHVAVQVLTPSREELIMRTARSLEGLPRTVLQVFNPTSTVQRRVVFKADRAQTKALALTGAEVAMRMRDAAVGSVTALQYAPESFTQTEPEFALEICNAVLDLWRPGPDDDVRINLPATVEAFPPQEFGDRIEWMHRNLSYRDVVTLSVHPHNDRGTAVAATEIALLAGADRVEGTLFGNGERTGNVCLITLAMNLFSQGVDPLLELGELDEVRRVVEECNGLPVSPRHPWGGDLVYTSFAGSHQDAISKGLAAQRRDSDQVWDVPYLPIDPHDVGRDYQALIRINNQSGKGGIAHVMRTEHGLDLPTRLQIEFSALVQRHLDTYGGEASPDLIWSLFVEEYLRPETEVNGAIGVDSSAEALLADFAFHHPKPARVLTVMPQVVRDSDADGAWRYCCCEVAVGTTAHWGAGFGETAREAHLVALRAALCRATERMPRTLSSSHPVGQM
ncbi:MAG: 2-isopropylmalate synthase [Pseudonocardia sp.]